MSFYTIQDNKIVPLTWEQISNNQKVMILARGVSGSGKSTTLKQYVPEKNIFSTDNFFMVDGKYRFDSSKLDEAHKSIKMAVNNAVASNVPLIGIDNTNVCWSEMSYYVESGFRNGYFICFLESDSPWWKELSELLSDKEENSDKITEIAKILASKNTHGVTDKKILHMIDEYELPEQFMSYWNALPYQDEAKTKKDEIYMAAKSGDTLAYLIEYWDSIGLLEKILPEIKALQGKEHNPIHHPEGDAFQHTMACLRASRSKDKVINLSVLFHDVGKSITYKNRGTPEVPKHTYWNHDKQGAIMMETIAKRFDFPIEDREAMEFSAYRHMLIHKPSEIGDDKNKELVTHKYWNTLKDVGYADEMSRPPPLSNAEKYNNKISEMEARHIRYEEAIRQKKSLHLNGKHLKDWIPDLQNIKISEILRRLKIWMQENFMILEGNEEVIKQKAIEINNSIS